MWLLQLYGGIFSYKMLDLCNKLSGLRSKIVYPPVYALLHSFKDTNKISDWRGLLDSFMEFWVLAESRILVLYHLLFRDLYQFINSVASIC